MPPSGIKKSEVSRICAGLDEIVGAFRTRRLDHIEFPYVYLDATYLHVRNADRPGRARWPSSSPPASPPTGEREVLGVDVGDSEDEAFWRSFLRSLKSRGLGGVRLVISDQHAGLVAALRRVVPRAPAINAAASTSPATCWPSCPKSHQDMVAAVFRTIFAQPDPATVAATWDQVRDQLGDRFPKIAALMDDAKAEVLAFSRVPAGPLDEDLVDQPGAPRGAV